MAAIGEWRQHEDAKLNQLGKKSLQHIFSHRFDSYGRMNWSHRVCHKQIDMLDIWTDNRKENRSSAAALKPPHTENFDSSFYWGIIRSV